MCTPWTVTRLVRWRVRDWALSLFACGCGFPLADEEPDTYPPSSTQMSIANMVFDPKDDTRGKKKNKKVSRVNRHNQEKRLKSGSIQATDTGLAENRTDDSSWPHFSDEDYIVFCFREDGAFDVVKDCKSEASGHVSCAIKSTPRSVNRKLNYGGDAERVHNHSHEVMLNEDGDHINPTQKGESISDKEAEEEESIYLDAESPSRSMRRGDKIEKNEECGTVSVESNGSNQSDGSTGSFAFPVLRWEWTGSPVQMPKSEGLRIRKQKARCVRLQCCRF